MKRLPLIGHTSIFLSSAVRMLLERQLKTSRHTSECEFCEVVWRCAQVFMFFCEVVWRKGYGFLLACCSCVGVRQSAAVRYSQICKCLVGAQGLIPRRVPIWLRSWSIFFSPPTAFPRSTEIKNRIRAAWPTFYKYKHELTSKSYFFRHRLRLFDMVTTQTMNYALGTWTLSKEHERMIQSTQRKMLRLIIRTKRKIQEEDTGQKWATSERGSWKTG